MAKTISPPPLLAIVSYLDGNGPTGVETHFLAVERLASDKGIDVLRIHPHGARSFAAIIQKLLRKTVGKFVGLEKRFLIDQRFNALVIRSRVKALLRVARGRELTFYAQDSLSSAIVARERYATSARLVKVVHFNHSEAEELVERGRTRPGGKLWNVTRERESASLDAADAIVFVSDYMKKHVLHRAAHLMGKSHLVYNFLESDPASPAPVPERDLIAIGTLEPRKNQSLLLDILAACTKLGHGYTLTIVGDGLDRQALEAKAVALGLSDAVHFAGHRTSAHLLIPSHRALIHTSRIENLPIALIEGLAHGRLVFALPVGGIPEIIDNGRQGSFLSEDALASAQTIVNVLEDPAMEASMQTAARARYRERFSTNAIAPVLLKILFPNSLYS